MLPVVACKFAYQCKHHTYHACLLSAWQTRCNRSPATLAQLLPDACLLSAWQRRCNQSPVMLAQSLPTTARGVSMLAAIISTCICQESLSMVDQPLVTYETCDTTSGRGVRITLPGYQQCITVQEIARFDLTAFAALWTVSICTVSMSCRKNALVQQSAGWRDHACHLHFKTKLAIWSCFESCSQMQLSVSTPKHGHSH